MRVFVLQWTCTYLVLSKRLKISLEPGPLYDAPAMAELLPTSLHGGKAIPI